MGGGGGNTSCGEIKGWVDNVRRDRKVGKVKASITRRTGWGSEPECCAVDNGILKMGIVQRQEDGVDGES